MASSQLLRRAIFYVPASSPRMIQKSLSYESDNVTYDLEDSVVDGRKSEARQALAQHLGSLRRHQGGQPREIAVRTNPRATTHGMRDILEMTKLPAVDAILLPKVDGPETVRAAAEMIASCDVERRIAWEEARYQAQRQRQEPKVLGGGPGYRPVTLMALIESARAVENLGDICRAGVVDDDDDGRPGALSGIVFGAEDFARDLGAERTPSLGEFVYARSRMVTAARAHGVPSVVDLVCTQLDRAPPPPPDTATATATTRTRLEEECENGRSMGFNGKQVIHPSQLATVHRVFGVPAAAAAWAVRVVAASAVAEREGLGAWVLDGEVVDAPVVRRARALVERARRVGYDVDAMLEANEDVRPDAK
ncbi:citrate lyase subunit beta [Gaeumannomyces tritici R3-111a-1]|uniref:Citrate lyase subunit beta n=1 Tax=Gaeumannomyces tritici (strain R3-111a-1) TaxID=644352 RepID=J3NKU7_GAET3|nr:citrate lyase subunit beta [Gaeumannomyces tritici R3-111a-1]EJT81914.1 citrate lyase subunit beta [Gaeumannomyces tritici R3-111a-1]